MFVVNGSVQYMFEPINTIELQWHSNPKRIFSSFVSSSIDDVFSPWMICFSRSSLVFCDATHIIWLHNVLFVFCHLQLIQFLDVIMALSHTIHTHIHLNICPLELGGGGSGESNGGRKLFIHYFTSRKTVCVYILFSLGFMHVQSNTHTYTYTHTHDFIEFSMVLLNVCDNDYTYDSELGIKSTSTLNIFPYCFAIVAVLYYFILLLMLLLLSARAYWIWRSSHPHKYRRINKKKAKKTSGRKGHG